MTALVSDAYRTAWRRLEGRIANGIRTHRMAQAEVRVVDQAGAPVPGAVVTAEQTGHAFHFGANCFLFGAYGDARDQRYQDHFRQLFNAATVAMYWRELEPEPGRCRFTADSEPRWRRPPTDPVIAWCREHGLLINGHTLVWDNPRWQVPPWMPADAAECARLTAQRIHQLAQRYGDVVQRWDVLNERLHSWRRPTPFPQVPMPADFDILAFREAQAALPAAATLMINDYYDVWNPRHRGYHELVRELEGKGARIDAIGLQMHSFSVEGMLSVCRDAAHWRGEEVAAALDGYLELGRPLHVSEITIPQPAETPEGAEAQAEVARDYYRLWFSHPAVSGITWWNFADGGAAPGEDGVLSGLIDREHRPKPAFHALDRLINHEWKTRTGALTAGGEGCVRFRGFKGAYRLAVEAGGRRTQAAANLAADGTITVTV